MSDIARAAHLCYKQDRSARPDDGFVRSLIKNGHMAMLEHGTVYLILQGNTEEGNMIANWYGHNPYSQVRYYNNFWHITTNYRVIIENHREDDLKHLCGETEYVPRRYSFHIITDRATATQILRHRKFSFAMESQRFCNYSQERFGNEVTFCMPHWYYESAVSSDWEKTQKSIIFKNNMKWTEEAYFKNIELGMPAEEARYVLPNATKTELIMTGFMDDWDHFLDLRLYGTTGKPHPEIKKLAEMIKNELNKNIYQNTK